MDKQHFIDRLKGLPVLFPLVAAFHVVMLVITVFNFGRDGVLDTFIGGGSVLEWLLYTALWMNVCLQRRWAAIGYIILTAVSLMLQFLTPHNSQWRMIGDTLFPFDVLLCFFLLFYYKRFR